MEKIKNGKVYSTDNADRKMSYSNGLSRSDFGYIRESIYKTKKGNWFMYGQGGPKTKYSQSVGGGGRSGGSEIQPLTVSEVKEWIENRGIEFEDIPDSLEFETA